MVAKRRITKRQLKEDHFVTTAFQFADYFQHHRNQVLLTAFGVVAVFLVGILLIRFQASSKGASATMLSTGIGFFQNGRYDEAGLRLNNFLESHGRSKDAGLAALLCGDSYYYMGRYDEAGEKYRTCVEKSSEGDAQWFAASAGLAAVDEAKGKPLAAAEAYAALAERSDDPVRKPHLLYAALRCYVDAADYLHASELLGRIDETKLDPIDAASYQWHKTQIELGMAGTGTSG